MPTIPGLLATPTVLLNALLSFAADKSLPVRGRDRVAVVSPMYNEEAGAGEALASLLVQTEPFDELVVSVNGGTDDTLGAVRRTLKGHGFARVHDAPAPEAPGRFERWYLAGGPQVTVMNHAQPISKADSINSAVRAGFVTAERVLVVDGDTVFSETFLERLKDNFYRLRRERDGKGWRYVIEDSAIQSGAVTSMKPESGGATAAVISKARAGEYALAAMLRRGQTARVGNGRVFGETRLYTVVGCGFTVRQSSFPMPSDTLTEDHDLTLKAQAEPTTESTLSVAELERRGFRIIVEGSEVAPRELFDEMDVITYRRSGTARFVTSALMWTEDPLTLGGYMRQVERWNGGGVENAVKRLPSKATERATPNVAFAAYSAQFENIFGLLLLTLLLPVLLGINFALPGYGTALAGLGAWLGFDLLATFVFLWLGFWRLWGAQGDRGVKLLFRTLGNTLVSAPALLLVRPLNAIAYVTAVTRVAPAAFRRREPDPTATITWERPRAVAIQRLGLRSTTVLLGLLAGMLTLFFGAVRVSEAARPGYKETWHLVNAAPRLTLDEYVELPIMTVSYIPPIISEEPAGLTPWLDRHPTSGVGEGGTRQPTPQPTQQPTGGPAAEDEREETLPPSIGQLVGAAAGISEHCSVSFTRQGRGFELSEALAGDPETYEPLTYWERLILGRLVPIAAHIEEASTAYGVPARLLLLILINESYLDPLAVGPTDDLGLSQVTGDALTLLREISREGSAFANPRLFSEEFSVFDPDFSICAGAAKLAWSRAQPGGGDQQYAYARYINPLEGVKGHRLNPLHAELVSALSELEPLVDTLRSAFAMYQQDEEALSSQERRLFAVYEKVKSQELDVRGAYFEVQDLMRAFGVDDYDFYTDVTERLYGTQESALAPTRD